MTVTTYDTSERTRRAAELLSSRLAERSGELILLPIPSPDGELVRSTDIPISDIALSADADDVVVGYALPDSFIGALRTRGACVVDL